MPDREKRPIDWLVNWALEGQGMGALLVGDAAKAGWMDLGVRVDVSTGSGGGGALLVDAPEYDATLIAEAIRGLPQEVAALLVQFGRLGFGEFARPDWCPEGVGDFQPVRTSTGKIKWEYADEANRRGEKRPKVEWVGHRKEHVDFYRAQYSLWWHGLAELVPLVNIGLARHEALMPSVPERPWDEPRPVVHIDPRPAKPVPPAASVKTRRAPRRGRSKAA